MLYLLKYIFTRQIQTFLTDKKWANKYIHRKKLAQQKTKFEKYLLLYDHSRK